MAPTPSKNRRRGLVQLLIAGAVVTVGAVLLILGFYAPPQGEIHGSVLVAFGEVLTFAGAILGIDYHYKIKSR